MRHGSRRIHRLLLLLRWFAPAAILPAAAAHEVLLGAITQRVPAEWHALVELVVYGVTGSVALWLALTWAAWRLAKHAEAQAQLEAAHDEQERAQERLAALHDIGCRLVSAGSSQELLQLTAQVPLQLTDACGSAVLSFDERSGRMALEIAWGLSDQHVAALRRKMEIGLPYSRCAHCIPLKASLSDDCPLFDGMRDLARAEHIQSVVCIPLGRGDKRTGIVALYLPREAALTPGQLQLLSIVATEVAAAMEGLRQRASEAATFYAVDRAARVSRDLDPLLDRVLEAVCDTLQAETGEIALLDPESGTYDRRVRRPASLAPLADDGPGLPAVNGLTGTPPSMPGAVCKAPWVRQDSVSTTLGIPLLADDQPLGLLVLGIRRVSTLATIPEALLKAIGHQVGLAVQNARLYARLEQVAVLEERQRLAREMHDGLAQSLAYLGMAAERMERLLASGDTAEAATELASVRQVVRDAYLDVREAIDGLRLRLTHPGGLEGALREYTADFAKRTGLEVVVSCSVDGVRLSPMAEAQLLRVLQEALTNVRKHAQAARVHASLSWNAPNIELVVADDGRGFLPGLPRAEGQFGLAIMRERVEGLGGHFLLAAGPGQGTRITASVPVHDSGSSPSPNNPVGAHYR